MSRQDDPEFKARLDRLGKTLDAKQPAATVEDGQEARGRAMGVALRLVSELIAGVVVGGGLGWLLDRWLGTAPLLMIVLLLLGIAAGLVNTMRAAKKMQAGADPRATRD